MKNLPLLFIFLFQCSLFGQTYLGTVLWYEKQAEILQNFDGFVPQTDSIAFVAKGGKAGLLHIDGRLLTECNMVVGDLEKLEGDGFEYVNQKKKIHHIFRPDGKSVFPKKHDWEEWLDDSCRYATFQTKKGFQLYDREANLLCSEWFANILDVHKERIIACKNETIGLWDFEGNCLTKEYDWLSFLSDSLIQAQKNHRYGLLDFKGKVVFPLQSPFFLQPYSDSLFIGGQQNGIVFNNRGKYINHLDAEAYIKFLWSRRSKLNQRNNREFLESDEVSVEPFLDGYCLQNDTSFRMVDANGKLLWELECDDVDLEGEWSISGDDFYFSWKDFFYFIFWKNGKYGLVNLYGEVMLEPIYDRIERSNWIFNGFSEGQCAIWNPKDEQLSDFTPQSGYRSSYQSPAALLQSHLVYGYYDSYQVPGLKYSNRFPSLHTWRSGPKREVFSETGFPKLEKSRAQYRLFSEAINKATSWYDSIVGNSSDALFFVQKSGKVGLVNQYMEEILPCRFQSIAHEPPYYFAKKGKKIRAYIIGRRARRTKLDMLRDFSSQELIGLYRGKKALYDYDLKQLLPYEYDQLLLGKEMIAARKGKQIFLYDRQFYHELWKGEGQEIGYFWKYPYLFFRKNGKIHVLQMESYQTIELGASENWPTYNSAKSDVFEIEFNGKRNYILKKKVF